MRLLVLVLLLFLLSVGCSDVSSTTGGSEGGADWVDLFDGQTLDGWHNPYDWGEVWVEDGEIHLRADQKFFLVTDAEYSDFEMEASVYLPDTSSNSGIMFRAHAEPNNVYGYQAEVDPTARAWSGGLYDEGRRGWLNPDREDDASVAAFRMQAGDAYRHNDWNRYRIRAAGDSLWISLNGIETTSFRDTVDSRGHIGIQHHGEAGKVYRFRDIRVRQQPFGASNED